MADNTPPEPESVEGEEQAEPDRTGKDALFDTVSDDVRSMGTRSKGDEPPEGAVAQAEDFLVQRDEQENVIPVWERIPGTQTYALVEPLSNGEAERRLPADGNLLNMEDDELLALIKEKFKEPDLSAARSLDDIKAFGVEPLAVTIINASGFEMTRGIVSENSDMMELMQAVEGNSSGGNSGRPPTGSS